MTPSRPGGVWVYAPSGELIGRLLLPEPVANLAWGGADFRTLFLTARFQVGLYMIMSTIGLRPRREASIWVSSDERVRRQAVFEAV